MTDDIIKGMEEAIKRNSTEFDNLPEATMPKSARPFMPTTQPATPLNKTIFGKQDEKLAKVRDTLGCLPARTLVAFRDAASATNARDAWDDVELALHQALTDRPAAVE